MAPQWPFKYQVPINKAVAKGAQDLFRENSIERHQLRPT